MKEDLFKKERREKKKKKKHFTRDSRKAKITKGEELSVHLSIFFASAGGLYYEPQKHPPFSSQLFFFFFYPFSNNVTEKNHTINWAMVTEEVA